MAHDKDLLATPVEQSPQPEIKESKTELKIEDILPSHINKLLTESGMVLKEFYANLPIEKIREHWNENLALEKTSLNDHYQAVTCLNHIEKLKKKFLIENPQELKKDEATSERLFEIFKSTPILQKTAYHDSQYHKSCQAVNELHLQKLRRSEQLIKLKNIKKKSDFTFLDSAKEVDSYINATFSDTSPKKYLYMLANLQYFLNTEYAPRQYPPKLCFILDAFQINKMTEKAEIACAKAMLLLITRITDPVVIVRKTIQRSDIQFMREFHDKMEENLQSLQHSSIIYDELLKKLHAKELAYTERLLLVEQNNTALMQKLINKLGAIQYLREKISLNDKTLTKESMLTEIKEVFGPTFLKSHFRTKSLENRIKEWDKIHHPSMSFFATKPQRKISAKEMNPRKNCYGCNP
jgi:hypothetical protein